MKIAFVGKGGSGKTTLASLLVSHLVAEGLPTVAIDADINQHLSQALGLEDGVELPALGDHLPTIKEYLRGTNPRIASVDVMIKTTPPGTGSRLLRHFGDDPFHTTLSHPVKTNLKLMVTGAFTEEDLGVACYHAKTGAVELYLNHLVDGPGEYVVVDMTAGADTFASGLFTRFDVLFVVVEPTLRSIGVYRQFTEYAKDYNVTIKVVGNKVQDKEDVAFLREQVGEALLAWLEHSKAVRAVEQGRPGSSLDQSAREALTTLQQFVDAQHKDWHAYLEQATLFHLKNARAWGNEAVGADVVAQVDPAFTISPPAVHTT